MHNFSMRSLDDRQLAAGLAMYAQLGMLGVNANIASSALSAASGKP